MASHEYCVLPSYFYEMLNKTFIGYVAPVTRQKLLFLCRWEGIIIRWWKVSSSSSEESARKIVGLSLIIVEITIRNLSWSLPWRNVSSCSWLPEASGSKSSSGESTRSKWKRKQKRSDEPHASYRHSSSGASKRLGKSRCRASLVTQWLRIHLPMQGTWVQSLAQEDPTCRGATKPVRHNCWAHVLQLLKPVSLEPVLHNKRSHHNEKPVHHKEE